MKKITKINLFFVVLLLSCNSFATPLPLSSPMPVNIVDPTPSLTPEPTQISTPIPNTFFDISRFSFITLNSITSIPVSELLYDKWIVGNDGLVFRYRAEVGSFSRIDIPVRTSLVDVDFVSPDDGWIVGEGSLILHWNGEEWSVSKPATIDSGGHYHYNFYQIAFAETNDGWAAGCTSSEGGEYLLVYHWDGSVWSETSVSDDRNLWVCAHDISVLASNDVWITGTGWESGKEYGITVHWDGNAWEIVSELASYNIQSLSALSSDDIWAVTRFGIVLHWNGTEWSEITQLESAGSVSVPIIYAQGSDNVFVASNRVWHWDGKSWTDISVPSNIEEDSKIVDMVAFPSPAFPLETWMLDSSGMIYQFYWRK